MSNKEKTAQDILFEPMIEDYHTGKYPDLAIFKPYIEWKEFGGVPVFSKEESLNMREKAACMLDSFYERYPEPDVDFKKEDLPDPWVAYAGFKEDKYMVSFLEAIESELCYIHGIL